MKIPHNKRYDIRPLLIDRKDQSEGGEVALYAQPMHRRGKSGMGHSAQAVLNAKLMLTPPYALIHGKSIADKDDPIWTQDNDCFAERLTALDTEGYFGIRNKLLVLDIVNGGLVVGAPKRIIEAVKTKSLTGEGTIQLGQEEVNSVLKAIKDGDTQKLTELVHAPYKVIFAGNYIPFLQCSQQTDFVRGMGASYIVVRRAEDARGIVERLRPVEQQRTNSDLIIAAGGERHLDALLDHATAIGWKHLGSWHDTYDKPNIVRPVVIYKGHEFLVADVNFNNTGRYSGLNKQVTAAFYGYGKK